MKKTYILPAIHIMSMATFSIICDSSSQEPSKIQIESLFSTEQANSADFYD